MASDNRTAHESTLGQPSGMMETALINLRHRACRRLSVRVMGPPRFITKLIGLARFAFVNPR